eukprot:m.169813 g.169813  ORF g.169813 m.169813 type:complete len:84 (-) comp16477_c0_seq4:149-400(-)
MDLDSKTNIQRRAYEKGNTQFVCMLHLTFICLCLCVSVSVPLCLCLSLSASVSVSLSLFCKSHVRTIVCTIRICLVSRQTTTR